MKKKLAFIAMFLLTLTLVGCSGDIERETKEYDHITLEESYTKDPLDTQLIAFMNALFFQQEGLDTLNSETDVSQEEFSEELITFTDTNIEFLDTSITNLKDYKETALTEDIEESEEKYIDSVITFFTTTKNLYEETRTFAKNPENADEFLEEIDALEIEEENDFVNWQVARNEYLAKKGFEPDEVKKSYEEDLSTGVIFD